MERYVQWMCATDGFPTIDTSHTRAQEADDGDDENTAMVLAVLDDSKLCFRDNLNEILISDYFQID
ncbi:hypothetical protein SFRURICE_017139 [Spodoptera frugiperda]|nr:hypothetical protein SFRURICE_017139 [Spodoptera frugiperda]